MTWNAGAQGLTVVGAGLLDIRRAAGEEGNLWRALASNSLAVFERMTCRCFPAERGIVHVHELHHPPSRR